MAIKLIKACKELNIGMSTAVEFAAKQGKEIAADPNVRIDDELYLLLAKAFNKDMALKLEAEKQAQERLEREIPKTVSVEPAPEPELLHPVQKPKVLGKIDLQTGKRIEDKPVETPPVQPKKEEPKPEPKVTIEQPKPPVETEKPIEKVVEKAPEPEPTPVKVEQPKAERENKPADKPAKEQSEPKRIQPETTVETSEAAQPTQVEKPADEPEVFSLAKPKLAKTPVVVGKIDLSSINQATHPRTKTKEEKKAEREERKQAEAQRKQAAKQNGEGKRKRERIKQGKVDVNDVKNQKVKAKTAKKGVRVEIDDEEVQKQIKDTIARLQGSHGKTNASKYRKEKREQIRSRHETEMAEEAAQSKVLKLTEFVTANDLAVMMNVPVTKIIGTCMSLGIMVSINQRLDAETINIVAEEFGFQTEYVSAKVVESIVDDDADYSEEDLQPRAPIVTVMGHVDHGKTSLLDHIRNTNVIAGEAGGITQHIGAYNVQLKNGQHITFLDTPGHEAFTAMRARGAKVTDLAIIIVAADDGVMPQTKEAISHAQAAGVPMIFAINKCDKPGANPEKIKEELANMNLLVEEWGGKYQSQDISAKKGTGVFELLEKVLLEAELLDLKANPKRRAKGSIIESSLDKGRGYVATLLVSDGTLHMGDVVLAGTSHGRIKAMFNERNQRITEALPGEPAVILGLNGAPQAGDEFNVLPTEQEAREIAAKREQLQREQAIRTKKHVGLEEIGRRLAIGDFKELNIIVKADVDGSTEAIADSLIKLSTENIQVNVIHKAVGAISDSDIMLAAASDAIIIGFNVRPTGSARKMAENEDVDIRLYSIIYDAIEEVKAAMQGMLAPETKEEVTGTLEVLRTFHITKVGTVAGCVVREGKIKRSNKVRVIRDGIVIFTGELASLKHEKDDVKEMATNQECGVSIRSYNDLIEHDLIESFETIEVQKTL
ncbi:MAG: translation initiation factor IF-2 [Paludibacteraceae bacterium]|nr:translation initiation factor IF-2 [Paludibacteraceae bacterium]